MIPIEMYALPHKWTYWASQLKFISSGQRKYALNLDGLVCKHNNIRNVALGHLMGQGLCPVTPVARLRCLCVISASRHSTNDCVASLYI